MLEMQPKWKIERIKKIDYVARVAGVRKGGSGRKKNSNPRRKYPRHKNSASYTG